MTKKEFDKLNHGDAVTIEVDGKAVRSEVFLKGGEIVECVVVENGRYVTKHVNYANVQLVKDDE